MFCAKESDTMMEKVEWHTQMCHSASVIFWEKFFRLNWIIMLKKPCVSVKIEPSIFECEASNL